MDPYVLPTEFNTIVIGTGLVESIVSAAACRVGKTVLHIDNQPNYGGDWASFNLENIQDLPKYGEPSESESKSTTPISIGTRSQLKDVEVQWHIPEKEEVTEEGDSTKWSQETLLAKSNKFIIELAPKLHFANGDLVQLLITSNIARYTEFRSVSRILTYFTNKLDTIPCCRADIFSNPHVNIFEKRMLMKLFTAIIEEPTTEYDDPLYIDRQFKDVLEEKNLTPRCIHYIIHAIAMTTVDESCVEGMKKIKRFLKSIGRFGKTPFLYCMWGSAEIPQAFCRISAVFGGVYALNQPLKEYKFDADGNVKSLICGEQEIHGEKFVTGIGCKVDGSKQDEEVNYVSRCILLTDATMMKSETGEHLTLLLFPSQDGLELAYAIEAGCNTGTTIEGVYLVYFFIKQKTNPREDLKYYIDKLYANENGPKVLWSCYFSMPVASDFEMIGNNGFLCPGPDIDLDYDDSIKQAKSIFQSMYPDEEFLPRAPDPEEIIIGDDDEQSQSVQEPEPIQPENVVNED